MPANKTVKLERTQLTVRCYYEKACRDIEFDKAGYQQFLRDQGLSEQGIKRLNICLLTDFTCLHFKGCADLAPGGTYYHHARKYVEEMNKMTLGLYRPIDLPTSEYAAIFLRPLWRVGSSPLQWHYTFLHETRHHIQHCLKLPCCSTVAAKVENASSFARNQLWEIDAEEFAMRHVNRVPHFLKIISRPPTRSILYE